MTSALLVGCKKDKESPQTIVGGWELRSILGVQVAGTPSTYKAGNGNIIGFNNSEYQNIKDGKVISKKTYVIIKDAAEIDGTMYTDALKYNDERLKWHYKITGDKLMLSIGSIASDGVTLTYQRLK